MFGLTNNFVLLGGRVVLHYNLKRDVVFNNVIVVLTYFRVLVPRVVGGGFEYAITDCTQYRSGSAESLLSLNNRNQNETYLVAILAQAKSTRFVSNKFKATIWMCCLWDSCFVYVLEHFYID